MKKTGKNGKGRRKQKRGNAIVYLRRLKAEKSKETAGHNLGYIGQTQDLSKRNGDWRNLKKAYGGKKIERARRLYGTDDWELIILYEGNVKKKSTRKKKLDRIETAMIKLYNTVEEGFNSSYGHGMKGLHHSKASKLKISQSMRGIKKTEAHKKAMSEGKKKAKQRRLRQERKLQRQQQQQSLNSAA